MTPSLASVTLALLVSSVYHLGRLSDSTFSATNEGHQVSAKAEPDPAQETAGITSGQESAPTSADDHHIHVRPNSLAGGPIILHHRDGHRIWAELNAQGALVISGQDLRPPNGWEEYEYAFTIPPEDLPLIREALTGTHEDSVLELLAANAEQIVPAVKSWLEAVGARYEFWSRIETDHG